MKWFRFLLPVFSFVILGAHFLRGGSMLLVLLCLGAPLLLLVRKKWALYTVQSLLAGGVLVWINTLVGLVMERMALGIPWVRMTLILAAVVLLTVYSILLLRAPAIKASYK